jgi:hypothetical protein
VERNDEILDALPVYPGAVAAETTSEEYPRVGEAPGLVTSRSLELRDGGRTKDVAAFYERELLNAGWTMDRGYETTTYHDGRAYLVVSFRMAASGRPPLIVLMVDGEGYPDRAPVTATLEAPPPPAPPCPRRATTPEGWLVAVTLDRRFLTLPQEGAGACALARYRESLGSVDGLDLTPDRRRIVFAARSDGEDRVLALAVETGQITEIARNAMTPAVSPNGRVLAYTESIAGLDLEYRKAIALHDLTSGATRRMPYPEWTVLSDATQGGMSWSPDGRRLTLAWDGVRTLDIASADTTSATVVPGTAPAGRETPPLSPAFLDDDTLAAYGGCCVGPGELLAIDVRTGAWERLAAIEAPLRSIDVQHATRRVALVTELTNLLVWDGRALRLVRSHVSRAAW